MKWEVGPVVVPDEWDYAAASIRKSEKAKRIGHGVKAEGAGEKEYRMLKKGIFRILLLAPDTRHLKPSLVGTCDQANVSQGLLWRTKRLLAFPDKTIFFR